MKAFSLAHQLGRPLPNPTPRELANWLAVIRARRVRETIEQRARKVPRLWTLWVVLRYYTRRWIDLRQIVVYFL